MKQFVMMSGLPRSGSSVLCSILNQHPDIHASTTSPVIELIEIVHANWKHLSSCYINSNPSQYTNMIHGLCLGAYEHINESLIIDKNRLWPKHGKLMNSVLGHKPKMIITVRDIPEILASYILLINKNFNNTTFIDQDLIDNNIIVNNKNRCKLLWETYINVPYNNTRVGFNSPDIDVCIVTYNQIVNNSQETVDRICKFLNIDTYSVDLNNIQGMNENDDYHGGIIGLHEVRPIMKRTSPPPSEVIGHELVKHYTNMKLDFWNK